MDFASKHVYIYDNSDEEYVSDDELEGEIELDHSDEETPTLQRDSSLFGGQPNRSTMGSTQSAGPSLFSASSAPPPSSSGGLFAAPARPTLFTDSTPSSFGPQACAIGFRPTAASNPTYESAPAVPFGAVMNSGDRGNLLATTYTGSPNRPKPRKMHTWQTYAAGTVSAPALPSRTTRANFHRRADVNMVNVKFDQLISPSNMHAGEAVSCKCGAVMSHISKVEDKGGNMTWTCEFCGHTNIVDVLPEEKPTQEEVTFMIAPAPFTTATTLTGADESMVVFCVDVSGSMCVTTEVQGDIKLKGSERLARLQSLNRTHEDQYLPHQRRNVTYVSRLQGVQAAIDHQLSQMEKDHPNRRVALVTFNSEVTVVGDGTSDPVTIAGDRLLDKDGLLKTGSELKGLKPIKETKKLLADKLWDLEEGGQTALGPAMAVAISLASQHRGSKVIMCTDGAANIGVGNLSDNQEPMETDDMQEERDLFYTGLTSLASSKGVSVSVITIKGTECGMMQLGKVAADTGGQVNIVDPLNLTTEFGNILANPVIATNVRVTFIVHNNLYIRGATDHKNQLTKVIGNVTVDTVQSFEYGVVKKSAQETASCFPGQQQQVINEVTPVVDPTYAGYFAAPFSGTQSSSVQETGEVGGPKSCERNLMDTASLPEEHAAPDFTTSSGEKEEEPKDIPFQLVISYTDRDGAKAMKVVTQVKPTTRDRDVAERDLNVEAITVHTKFTSAQLASDGCYGGARKHAMMKQRLVSRVVEKTGNKHAYNEFVSNIAPLENVLSREQRRERALHGGTTLSDDEDSEDEDEGATHRTKGAGGFFSKFGQKKKKGGKQSKLAVRMRGTSDEVASTIYEQRISSKSVPLPPREDKNAKTSKK